MITQAVADGVLRLLDDPALVTRLTAQARARCESCTWPAVRELWIDAYRSVLERRMTSRAAGDRAMSVRARLSRVAAAHARRSGMAHAHASRNAPPIALR